MRLLYVAYEDCPVATSFIGYMGKINGTWYITTEMGSSYTEAGYPRAYKVSCYAIPDKYIEIVEKYFT